MVSFHLDPRDVKVRRAVGNAVAALSHTWHLGESGRNEEEGGGGKDEEEGKEIKKRKRQTLYGKERSKKGREDALRKLVKPLLDSSRLSSTPGATHATPTHSTVTYNGEEAVGHDFAFFAASLRPQADDVYCALFRTVSADNLVLCWQPLPQTKP